VYAKVHYYSYITETKQQSENEMETYFIEPTKVETTKSHNGFNYVQIDFNHNMGSGVNTTFECNCSIFKTEVEVKAFIEEVFA
jgi:hypothetical protein